MLSSRNANEKLSSMLISNCFNYSFFTLQTYWVQKFRISRVIKETFRYRVWRVLPKLKLGTHTYACLSHFYWHETNVHSVHCTHLNSLALRFCHLIFDVLRDLTSPNSFILSRIAFKFYKLNNLCYPNDYFSIICNFTNKFCAYNLHEIRLWFYKITYFIINIIEVVVFKAFSLNSCLTFGQSFCFTKKPHRRTHAHTERKSFK